MFAVAQHGGRAPDVLILVDGGTVPEEGGTVEYSLSAQEQRRPSLGRNTCGIRDRPRLSRSIARRPPGSLPLNKESAETPLGKIDVAARAPANTRGASFDRANS